MNEYTTLVTVIMPMRNTEPYVAKAIESILNQSFQELELLVIDNKSTDNSRSIAESYAKKDKRLKLITGTVEGISATRNLGLEKASGKIIMFCDSDDYFAAERIKDQAEWMRQHPNVGAVCTAFAMVDNRGSNVVHLESAKEGSEITEELLSGKTRTHLCTFAIRSDVAKLTNGFREFFVSAEDIDFQLRLAEVCNVFYESKVSYYYRLHNTSTVHTQASTTRLFFEETAREFSRQRRNNGKDELQLGNPPQIPTGIDFPSDAKTQLQGVMIGTAWRLHRHGDKLEAIKCGLRACLIIPVNLSAWKSFVMLIIK